MNSTGSTKRRSATGTEWLPRIVGLLGVLAIFMATWGARLEVCPGDQPEWRINVIPAEQTGCDYHAWWRVQAGNLGLLSDVNE